MTPARLNLLVALAVFAGIAFAVGTAFTIVGIQRRSPRWHWAATVLFAVGTTAVAAVVVISDAPPLVMTVVGEFAVFTAGNGWMAVATRREAGR